MLEKIKKSKEEQREDFVKMVELRGGKYCNKCFDRGYMYWDTKLECYMPCDCLVKFGMKLEQEKLAAKRVNELEVQNG
jgi:hypothetical protein